MSKENQNILFYSSVGCLYSEQILKKIKDEKLIDNFKLINVYELYKSGKQIPSEITETPTMIIYNIPKPLVGAEAFDWIDNHKYFYQKTNNVNNVKIAIPIITECKDAADLKKNDEFANIKDNDDEETTKKKYNGATQNNLITNSEKYITEQKMTMEIQNKKLQELLLQRKLQLSRHMK